MNADIQIYYDDDINGYVVRFLGEITLTALQHARQEFEKVLSKGEKEPFSLLFDVGEHDFASIEALKYVREFLSIPALLDRCECFVSVAPPQFSMSEIKSEKEAVFNDYEEAYAWLAK